MNTPNHSLNTCLTEKATLIRTFENAADGLASLIFDDGAASKLPRYRVVFRDTDAGETVTVVCCPSEALAVDKARAFVNIGTE